LEEPLPRNFGRTALITFLDADDYANFAEEPGVFPEGTSMEMKAIDYDFDYDGFTNGDEFASGTDVNDASDYFRSRVIHNKTTGTRVYFSPYLSNHHYTLYSAFEGDGFQSTPLSIPPQASEENPNEGLFQINNAGLDFVDPRRYFLGARLRF
jgi:hypothetical protein